MVFITFFLFACQPFICLIFLGKDKGKKTGKEGREYNQGFEFMGESVHVVLLVCG
jgi:hypothetical protein